MYSVKLWHVPVDLCEPPTFKRNSTVHLHRALLHIQLALSNRQNCLMRVSPNHSNPCILTLAQCYLGVHRHI